MIFCLIFGWFEGLSEAIVVLGSCKEGKLFGRVGLSVDVGIANHTA